MAKTSYVVGLDVGSSKTCAVVGQNNEKGQIEIIGMGSVASTGLRKGVVSNLENTVADIEKAIDEAERVADLEIDSVFLGIGGSHIRCQRSRGVIAISRSDKEITPTDVQRVIDQARAIPIPLEQEVMHVLPQKFIIDDQDGITDPVGMSGIRLETEVLIITGGVAAIQNMVKCVNKAGLRVNDIVLGSLATSEAVILPDEKELGVVLIDVGGGKVDLVIFNEGNLGYTSSLAIGGNLITKDISFGLRTAFSEAEEIKKNYGWALKDLVQDLEEIPVKSVAKKEVKKISPQALADIIEPRVEEMLSLISREIQKSGFANLIPAGVVLTGGTGLLLGIDQFAERIFNMPVRIGIPHGVVGLSEAVNSPLYALSVGLVEYALKEETGRYGKRLRRVDNVFTRVREWIEDIF